MDSITQAALGAAIGEAVLGKKAGNRAPLYGAVAAIIPDLDIVFMPLLDEVQKLTFHRGISHSFAFLLVLTPLLGVCFQKIYPDSNTSRYDWMKLSFWSLMTHPLLDAFTSYGTQLFLPFSDYRVAFNSIFIMDPVYTLPMIIGVTISLFLARIARKRRIANFLGLGAGILYLSLTVVNKLHINAVFEKSLKAQNITYSRFLTNPAPFTNILWMAVVEGEENYFLGYYSLLDNGEDIKFFPIRKNHELLEPFGKIPAVRSLVHVSNGYYIVERADDALIVSDIKFGQMGGWVHGDGSFIFSYRLIPVDAGHIRIERFGREFGDAGKAFEQLVARIRGI